MPQADVPAVAVGGTGVVEQVGHVAGAGRIHTCLLRHAEDICPRSYLRQPLSEQSVVSSYSMQTTLTLDAAQSPSYASCTVLLLPQQTFLSDVWLPWTRL